MQVIRIQLKHQSPSTFNLQLSEPYTRPVYWRPPSASALIAKLTSTFAVEAQHAEPLQQ
jgi:hypothetical protein